MKRLLLLLIGFSLMATPAHAETKRKKTYAMSMKIFKQMEKAQLMVDEDKLDEAVVELTDLLEKRSSDYEKAQIHNLMGSIYYRSNDYESALKSFMRVLDSANNMPLALHQQTLKTISQLNMMKEDYAKAKLYFEQLIAITEEPDQDNYAMLTQANYKLENWDDAIGSALKGREVAYELSEIPNENLLILLNAVYFEMNELEKMEPVLIELIKHYPKTSYMIYLASIYGQLDRLDKQLVLMESLYEDGKIKDRNKIRNLASLYMSESTPYKGAKVLERALETGVIEASAKDLELLAQAWQLAAERDKAVAALGQAAELSDSGKNYLQKAYLHFDMAQWNAAKESLMLGLDKGLEDKFKGEAWLLLGMTRFKLKQFDQAIEACEKAKDFKNSLKHAKQWITYISSEKRKYESMQAPIT